jgi:hypothetical protein
VFVLLAGAWYTANLFAFAAARRTQIEANAKIVAAGGHPPVFYDIPSVWVWAHSLTPALFGIVGAALIAVLLRRSTRWPWFLVAGALPVVIGHTAHLHGWWAPGAGIDVWTDGAGVGVPGLDLTSFGAGPSWVLVGGTVLAVAAAVAPSLLISRPTAPVPTRDSYFKRCPISRSSQSRAPLLSAS